MIRLIHAAEGENKKMICKQCGTDNSSTAKFCKACGVSLELSRPEPEPEPEYKYCTHCGAENAPTALFCMNCGTKLGEDEMFEQYDDEPQYDGYSQYDDYSQYSSQYQQQYGPQYGGQQPPEYKSKVTAGILGILLGAFGAHKFYLGYTKEALIMLLVSVLTLGIGGAVMGIIGLVEGILYLTNSDGDFYYTYVEGHKGWF